MFVVRAMSVRKISFGIITAVILSLTLFQGVRAQTPGELKTFFSKNYAGLSVVVNATQGTAPNGTITVCLWLRCTAENVVVNYLNLTVYGFMNGTVKTQLLEREVMAGPLPYGNVSEYDYNVTIPSDVWEATYGELVFKYAILDSPSPEYNPGFSMTIIRNVPMEELQRQCEDLTKANQQLNDANGNLTTAIEQLNQTYLDLKRDYTGLQGAASELDNTRRLALIFGITTVFFVATTIFMVMRRPKNSW